VRSARCVIERLVACEKCECEVRSLCVPVYVLCCCVPCCV
jgi:hypothetical protein